MPKSKHRKKRRRRSRGSWKAEFSAAVIREVSRFPVRECRINDEWSESLLASISIARNRPDGRVAVGVFNVDLGCLGVKSAFANPSVSVAQYEQRLVHGQPTNQVLIDACCAVKLIKGAYEYAMELGFSPDPDYLYARELFGEINDEGCTSTFEYGQDGKPFYVAGPYDDVDRIIGNLTRRFGPEGFQYVMPFGSMD